MLRFFRQIRQKLFLEGKVSRYIGYALGEILLIVVGILIALNIQNWNQNRLDRIEEREILERLYNEMERNKQRLLAASERIVGSLERVDRVIAVFNGAPLEDNIAFLDDVANLVRFDFRRQVNATYVELLSSGDFGLIQNVELRDFIVEYYDRIKQIEERGERRISDFAMVSYQLIPRSGPNRLREGLSDDDYAVLVQTVLNSELRRYLLQERNLIEYHGYRIETLTEVANEAQARIQTELAN